MKTTIEHKYNIGDKLWYISEDNYFQLGIKLDTVKRIVFIKDEDGEICRVKYVFGEVDTLLNSTSCEESEVSPDRDSLINIHIEKRKIAIANDIKKIEDDKNQELQKEIDRIKDFFEKEDKKDN
jgi:hypothetical protein